MLSINTLEANTGGETFASELLFPLPAQSELGLPEIKSLFEIMDWGIVLLHPRVRDNLELRKQVVSMFKALSLPFLLRIPSERVLESELNNKAALRSLCGFDNLPPTRQVFWHFRHSSTGLYHELMLRVLIGLAIAGSRLNLRLPFVREISSDDWDSGHATEMNISDVSNTKIEILISESSLNGKLDPVTSKEFSKPPSLEEYRRIENERRKQTRKSHSLQGVEKGLILPAKIKAYLQNGKAIYEFVIDIPEWLDKSYKYTIHSADPLTTIRSTLGDENVVCNILVLRTNHLGHKEVLLAQRLTGFGKGQFALPGGRKTRDEKISECAIRELLEETGITLKMSRPVSVKLAHFPNRKPTWSIGALALSFSGEPKPLETNQQAEWEWYSLDRLPSPIFTPTRFVIEDYVHERFAGLTWDDLEVNVNETRDSLNQASLDPAWFEE